MLLSIFINLVVITSAFIIAGIFIPYRKCRDFIPSWVLFYLCLIITVEIAWGIAEKLVPINIILSQLIIVLLLLFFAAYNMHNLSVFKLPTENICKANRILLFAIAVFAGFFVPKFWFVLMNPPFSSDALIYHLTFPVSWMKSANLHNPIVAFGAGSGLQATLLQIPYYPTNAELFFFWLMFPLRSPFLASISQAPFYIFSIITLYIIARKFGLDRTVSLFTGCLWALIPNCFKHIGQGAYIDIICAFLFFLVLDLLLRLEYGFNLKNAFIFGISLGLFLGTKTLNIFWVISLLPLFVYIFIKNIKQLSLKSLLFTSVVIIFGVILLCGYFYLRNWILTGNVFYPITFSVLGKVIMPGLIDKTTFADMTYHAREFSFGKLFFREGLGAQFFLFIFPATILAPLAPLFIKNKFNGQRIKLFLFFIIPALMFWMFLFVIRVYWTRYLYGYLGIAMVVAVVFIASFTWGRRYIFTAGLISVFASMGELSRRRNLAISFILTAAIFIFLLMCRRFNLARLTKRNIFILGLILCICFIFLNNRYEKSAFITYPQVYEDREVALGWVWLDTNTSLEGSRVAYAGQPKYYPLYGSKYKNDIFYVSVNGKKNVPHLYPDGLFRKHKDYNLWKRNLINKNIDYLFIYQNDESTDFPIEESWAKAYPDFFKEKFSNEKVRIYHLNK